MQPSRFRVNYGPQIKQTLECTDPSRTKQSFKDECNINKILERFSKTGELTHLMKAEPRYGDFADVGTFQEAMGVVAFAHEQFAALSAAVRKRFNNDPSEFLEFANNPENHKEMVKLGLAVVIPTETPPAANEQRVKTETKDKAKEKGLKSPQEALDPSKSKSKDE